MELLSPQIIILTLMLGACAGFLAGLLGIGGGVILVPLFLWLFPLAGFPPDLVVHSAFGTSLAIVFPTAISSTLAHRKRGNVDWYMVIYLTLGGIAGSVLGSSLAAVLPGDKLKIAFGVMQILVSLKLIFYKNQETLTDYQFSGSRKPLLLIGLIGGFFSAFFGIGGGVVAVPLMFMLLRVPIRLAVGNSSALIVVSSLAAVVCYIWYGLQQTVNAPFSLGYVNILVAVLVAPLTIIFARIGVTLASRISQAKLVKVFALLLMVIGLKIVFKI